MPFRENLLKKIEINRLAGQVRKTIAPAASDTRLDKESMRQLLEHSSFEHRTERDLDLYVKPQQGEPPLVLVLDNELPMYRTRIEDVVMRKSPYIKEMASIRNIVKILRDSDVKIARKEQSLEEIQKDCLAALDLGYTREDIEAIAYDGKASLESNYPEGVLENASLFAELLGYQPPPPPYSSAHQVVLSRPVQQPGGQTAFGPFVIFDRVHGRLLYLAETIDAGVRSELERYQKVVAGREKASAEGGRVFDILSEAVLQPAGPV